MTPEQEAEQAWKEFEMDACGADFQIINFFKSALKLGIEKRIKMYEAKQKAWPAEYNRWQNHIDELKWELSLLETVKP